MYRDHRHLVGGRRATVRQWTTNGSPKQIHDATDHIYNQLLQSGQFETTGSLLIGASKSLDSAIGRLNAPTAALFPSPGMSSTDLQRLSEVNSTPSHGLDKGQRTQSAVSTYRL